jgi:methylated-DNA-[protein]-cysteine S-methyltransferase
MKRTYSWKHASPIGELLLASNGEALTGLYMEVRRHGPRGEEAWTEDRGPFKEVLEQLDAYFAGARTSFALPLAPEGSAFQLRVWSALEEIPFGQTWSYRRLAEQVGRPGAARAVGSANARNPISIVVPCHRVIGSAGALTGYGGGLPRKRWLLDHEARAWSQCRSVRRRYRSR